MEGFARQGVLFFHDLSTRGPADLEISKWNLVSCSVFEGHIPFEGIRVGQVADEEPAVRQTVFLRQWADGNGDVGVVGGGEHGVRGRCRGWSVEEVRSRRPARCS